MQRLQSITSPVLAPNPVATGSPTEHTFPTPSPKSDFAASNHHARAARVLESGRIGATLRMYHFPAKRVQNGARIANGAHAAPPPRIFSQPDCLRVMYMLCMVGSGNGASKGGRANWSYLGGSSGGETVFYLKLIFMFVLRLNFFKVTALGKGLQ